MRGTPAPSDSLSTLWDNLRHAPFMAWRSYWRRPATASARGRSGAVVQSLFLHIHSARIHRFSLRPGFTAGLGVATLAFFVLLIVTGVFLMIYYNPSTHQAFQTTKDIHYVVAAGRSVRNVHRWAAHLMVIAVFLHMARVFYTGAYRRPREFNWLIGLALLVLTLALSFTGYLLPWDQLAFWAVTIGANIASSPTELTDALGVTRFFDPGRMMRVLLLGADEVGETSLVRFYFLHCVLLPVAAVGLVAGHFWRIRKDGGLAIPDEVSPQEVADIAPEERPDEHTPFARQARETAGAGTLGLMAVVRPPSTAVPHKAANTVASWPHALRAELAVFMVCVAVSLLLAYVSDAPLKEPANPAVPENPAKAPWYFLGLQELVGYSAFMGGVAIPTLALVGLALIPYLDRRPGMTGRWFDGGDGVSAFRWSLGLSAAATVAMLVFTVRYGWLRSWFPDIPQIVIILINPGTVLVAAFAGLSLVTLARTRSTRKAAISLFTAFLVGFTILTYFATVHRGPNWDFFWTPGSWPVH
jgi:quinol-cytochrome oxidoreductase complex cytochrome b subunit